jgi:hypothetical protein
MAMIVADALADRRVLAGDVGFSFLNGETWTVDFFVREGRLVNDLGTSTEVVAISALLLPARLTARHPGDLKGGE